MSRVTIRDARKSYGSTEVIHGVDIDIADGEFAVIVGPSGCGKSTLLRMIAGLEEITAGDISIGENIVNDVEPKDRDIAMVFQNYALYPHMTVRENIAFGLKLRRVSAKEIDARIEKAAGILQLSELLNRRPSELSGGQRQRVAMGRAIVRDPKVFLFDEPLSNLDAKLRVQMRMEIKRLHLDLSATSVYVTHDQVEAMTMGDKLIVMNDGVVDQIGHPMDVYREPATVFVAGFIGSPPMNFISGTVGDDRNLHTADGLVILHDVRKEVPAGGVICGVRPEEIEICDGGETSFSLMVHTTEPLGAETLIYGAVGSTGLTLRTQGAVHFSPGDEINVRFPQGSFHLFDSKTRRRFHVIS
ncbi:MAG: ABC transporter ATP-binding protein [Halocynthiibacter sp.]